MPRATAKLRASDRARVLEVLEHAERALNLSDIDFRLRYGIPAPRLRVTLDALVVTGMVTRARTRFHGTNCLGQPCGVSETLGYTLARAPGPGHAPRA